jgi:hypothetical protein
MISAATQEEPSPDELALEEIPQQIRLQESRLRDRQVLQAERLRLLWDHRRLLARSAAFGFVASRF